MTKWSDAHCHLGVSVPQAHVDETSPKRNLDTKQAAPTHGQLARHVVKGGFAIVLEPSARCLVVENDRSGGFVER